MTFMTDQKAKDSNYLQKLNVFERREKREKKYSQAEVVLDFLGRYPNEWFYVWEIMGDKPLGWISHKVDVPLSDLSREGKVEIKYIGKYGVYSLHTTDTVSI